MDIRSHLFGALLNILHTAYILHVNTLTIINEKDGVRAMNAVHDAFDLAD